MKKSILLILMLLLQSFGIHAQTADQPVGSGTEGDPYQIATLNNLYWISVNPSTWGQHFIQTADIDASSTNTWNSGAGFSPIGSSTTQFIGSYVGNGYTISNLYINRTGAIKQGMFGVTGAKVDGNHTGAVLKKIGLVNVNIKGNSLTGGLVGNPQFSTSISECYVTGKVGGEQFVGGLAGYPGEYVVINKCYATCDVSGSIEVGGLVGVIQWDCTIENSYATGNVIGTSKVGGLVGYNVYSAIKNSYSTGSVTGGSEPGGLVGRNDGGTVANSFWDTQTSGQTTSAGGTGKTTAEMKTQSTFSGWDFSTIWGIREGIIYPYLLATTDCTDGTITLKSGSQNQTICAGTAITPIVYTIDGGATGAAVSPTLPAGLSGFYDESNKTFTISGTPTVYGNFSYTVETTGSSPCSEATATGNLNAFGYSGGDGTEGNPFQIATLADLQFLSENDCHWDKYFIQTANIDASATSGWGSGGWSPIGNLSIPFTGTYDGKGHTISNLFINRPGVRDQGLFGCTGNLPHSKYARIQNLGVTNVNINGGWNTGGLVGYNWLGNISNCYSTGAVTGNNTCVGGLVGTSMTFSSITYCYSEAVVVGIETWSVGGLVGELVGTGSEIRNCYSRGSVTSTFGGQTYETGGLAGAIINKSTIRNCYSTGLVSVPGGGGLVGYTDGSASVISSYWDITTSGTTTSAGGTAKTTTEMKTQTTFNGWDFTSVWAINPGKNDGYPYLAVESACIDGTLELLSGSSTQTIFTNLSITPIVYTVGGGAAGAFISPALPTGLIGIYDAVNSTYTISGKSSSPVIYDYSIFTTGTLSPCKEASKTGIITVIPQPECAGYAVGLIESYDDPDSRPETFTQNPELAVGLPDDRPAQLNYPGEYLVLDITGSNNLYRPSGSSVFLRFSVPSSSNPCEPDLKVQYSVDGTGWSEPSSYVLTGAFYQEKEIVLAANTRYLKITLTNCDISSGILIDAVTYDQGSIPCACVSSPDSPTADNNGPVCEGETLSLTASTVSGAIYSWTGPNGFYSTEQNPTVSAAATTEMAGTYSVTASVNGCTSEAAVTTAVVNPQPTAGLSSSDEDNTICTGDKVTFTASGGTLYEFFVDNISQGEASATNIFTTTLTNGQRVTVEVTTDKGCSATSDEIFFTVNPLPEVHIKSNNDPVCIYDNATFLLEGTPGAEIVYSLDGGATTKTVSLTGGNATVGVTEAPNDVTLSLISIIIPSTGCIKALTSTSTVTVNSPPAASISGSHIACGSATLTAVTNASSPTYFWETLIEDIWVPIGEGSTLEVNQSGEYYLRVIDDVTGCDMLSDPFDVTINPLPEVNISANSIFAGETTTLSPTSGGTWASSNTLVATVTNDGIVTGIGGGTATFTFTDATTGCTATTGQITVLGCIIPVATAPAVGDGSISNPYQIATLENLYWITASDKVVASPSQALRFKSHYIQTADIDASETADWCNGGWIPIGPSIYSPFNGLYDGQWHTISNLYINRPDQSNQAFFGCLDNLFENNLFIHPVRIQNLGLIHVNIFGGNLTAGLVAECSDGYISNCYTTGSVQSWDGFTGGLVGVTYNNSYITCCYSEAGVKGSSAVGGLVASIYNNGPKIINCYSRGTVTAFTISDPDYNVDGVGGLIGYNHGNAEIINSYSTGLVAGHSPGGLVGYSDVIPKVTNSFWDIITSNQETSYGGTDKTTEEMKTQSTFTNAGWDFAKIWRIDAGINDGYPHLAPVILSLSSGSNEQTVCTGKEITPIVYAFEGLLSGITISPELPSGLTQIIDPYKSTLTISGIPTTAGIYEYTVTTTGVKSPGTVATATGTITIYETTAPTVTVTSNDADNIICANKEVIFTATAHNTGTGKVGYQWYYYVNKTGTLYSHESWNGATWVYNEIENGDEIYCVITVTGGTCLTSTTATSDKITMEVYDRTTQPTVTIESDPSGEICPDQKVIFTAIPQNTEGGKVDYKWFHNGTYQTDYWNQDTWWNDELEDRDTVRCEITVTDAACYTSANASDEIIISVTPWPDAGQVTGKNLIQVGESTTLTAEIQGGVWYCFDDYEDYDVASIDEEGTVTGIVEGTAKVYYVLPLAEVQICNYEIAVTEFPIAVTSLPCTNPTNGGEISGTQTVCSGSDPIPFTSISEASGYHGTLEYKWQYSDVDDPYDWEDLSESNSAGFDDSQYTMSTRWYRRMARVTCSDDWTGAAESNVLKVMVDEADVSIMIMGPTTFCEGGSVKLQASDASSYLWSNGETTQEITVTTSGDYYVTITNGNGCSANTSEYPVSVTVNPMPTISGISVDHERSCYDPDEDPTLTFSGLIPGENNIFYALNEEHINEPLELVADDKGNATHSFDLGVGTFVFSIDEIRVKGGCKIHPSENNSVSWTVYEIPEANAGTGGDVCGLGFDLAATPSAGTGTWTKESGPGTADFNINANDPEAIVTVDEYGTYLFRWTEENGPCTDFDDVTVNFYQQPVADAGYDQSQCNHSTFTIGPATKAAIIGPSGTWSFNGDNGGAVIEDIYSETTTVTNVPFDQDITLRWTLTNGTCTDFDDVVLRNKSLPEASPAVLEACDHGFETADFTLTDADAVVIGAQTGVVVTYHATPTDADNDENALTSPYNSGSATVYARVETEATGCYVTSEVTLTVKSLPTFTSLTVDKEAICEDNELHEARVTITFGGLHNSDQKINVTFISNGNTEKALTGDETILQSDLQEKEGSYYYEIQLDEQPGSYQIIVNSISANGCTATYDENDKPSVSWVVYPGPTASISGDLETCGKTMLTAITDASNASYIWQILNGPEVIPIEGETGSTLEVTESGTYLVEITNTETGCIKGAKVEVTVRPQFTAGAIQTTGETICYNGDPGLIGSATDASGGDNVITYKWQADGSDIANSNTASYDPPAGLTARTTYTRWAKDGVCSDFTQSAGSWVVSVNELPVIIPSASSVTVQYSDPVDISITVTDDGITTPEASTQFNTNGGAFVPGLPNGLSWVNPSDGIWKIKGIADVAPGVYVVRIKANDEQCPSHIEIAIRVTQEDAIATYTGQEFVGEQNPSATTTPLLLSASVIDTDDGFRGDIRNARVQFYDVNTLAPLSGWLTPGLVLPGDPTQGVVMQIWDAPVPATGYNTFTIGIKVGTKIPEDNGYYIASDKAVVNVYRTDLYEFISGGGHINPTLSKGTYASDPGRKVNFGFNVKWNKTLKNLQGNLNLVFRIGEKVYQIRTNAMNSLSINSVNPCSQQAVFTSKANLSDVTLPGLPVEIKGNLNLQVNMTNNTSPGAVSTIGFTLYDGNTLLYSSNWPVNKTEELPVEGGNLVVHNGIRCITNQQVEVVLYSSNNPSFVGEEVIFKAVVTPKGSAVVPTGVVKFMDGPGDLATISLENGTASLAISNLSEGVHWVAAEYLSSGDYENNLSNIIEQKVTGAVLSIVSDKNPSEEGEPITFTATLDVPPGGPAPTGTVTFKDGESVLGISDLAGETASWLAKNLSAGNHTITSEYSGDANYLPISASMVQTVGSNIQIALVSSKNPEQVNTSVSFTATVTAAGSPATGTEVSFYINGVFWQKVSTDVSGKAVLSNSFKVAGTYLIEARYAGQSASLSQVIKNKVKSAVIVSLEINQPDEPEMKVYPNPFSDRLNFEFVSPADDRVRIDIFDNSGRCIETVFDNLVKAGVKYDAVLTPEKLTGGIYIYRMIMGDQVFNGKVIFNGR